MGNVANPTTLAQGQRRGRTEARAALDAAWEAGRPDDLLALLAPGGVIELLPAGRILETRDDQLRLLRSYLPDLALGSVQLTDDGAIARLTAWLLPDRSESPVLTAAPEPAAHNTPAPAASGSFAGLRLGRVLAVAAAAAVALPTVFAASSALLETVYGLRPDWRPDGPPAAIGVTLESVELEERRIEYEPGIAGNLISYDVELVGYRGDAIPVKWAAFDAGSQQRISLDPATSNARENRDAGVVTTEAPNDRVSANFRIPIPARAQCIFIRVYVYEDDAKQTRQDYLDSAPFDTHDPGNRACSDGGGTPQDLS